MHKYHLRYGAEELHEKNLVGIYKKTRENTYESTIKINKGKQRDLYCGIEG